MIYTLNTINNSPIFFEEFDTSSFNICLSQTENELRNILNCGVLTETQGKKFSERFQEFIQMVIKYLEKFINWLRGPFQKKQYQIRKLYKFTIYKHDFVKIMNSFSGLLGKLRTSRLRLQIELIESKDKSTDKIKEIEKEFLDKCWIMISDALNYDIKDISNFNDYISFITENEVRHMNLSEVFNIIDYQRNVLSRSIMRIKDHYTKFADEMKGMMEELDTSCNIDQTIVDQTIVQIINIGFKINTQVSNCIANLISQYNKYSDTKYDADVSTNESTIFSNIQII